MQPDALSSFQLYDIDTFRGTSMIDTAPPRSNPVQDDLASFEDGLARTVALF